MEQGGREWPESLTALRAEDQDLALQSLGMSMAFLEESLLSDMTLTTGEFLIYTPET